MNSINDSIDLLMQELSKEIPLCELLHNFYIYIYFSKSFPTAEILLCESVLYVDSKNI